MQQERKFRLVLRSGNSRKSNQTSIHPEVSVHKSRKDLLPSMVTDRMPKSIASNVGIMLEEKKYIRYYLNVDKPIGIFITITYLDETIHYATY